MSRKKIKTCVRCGVRCSDNYYEHKWGGETYLYCYRCKEVALLLKSKKKKRGNKKPPPFTQCEGCSCGKARSPYKLCRDCYWRSKAAQGALEQALNKKMAQETDS